MKLFLPVLSVEHFELTTNNLNRETFYFYFEETMPPQIKFALMAIQEATKKWTMPIRDRGTILNQFMVIFEDRLIL